MFLVITRAEVSIVALIFLLAISAYGIIQGPSCWGHSDDMAPTLTSLHRAADCAFKWGMLGVLGKMLSPCDSLGGTEQALAIMGSSRFPRGLIVVYLWQVCLVFSEHLRLIHMAATSRNNCGGSWTFSPELLNTISWDANYCR